jgi:hypothetical protein
MQTSTYICLVRNWTLITTTLYYTKQPNYAYIEHIRENFEST